MSACVRRSKLIDFDLEEVGNKIVQIVALVCKVDEYFRFGVDYVGNMVCG